MIPATEVCFVIYSFPATLSSSSSQQPAVPGLPSEIYLAIFEHLRSTRDLSSIALACCLFSRLARPLIYRDIIAPTTNTPRLLSLLTTLAADRALAHAVRRFHLVHGPEHGFLTGILHIDSEIVALVLLAMDNLIELEIGLPNDVPWDMLRMCSFRLREFTLHGATADAEQLLQFLEHQEDLIALQMRQAELSTQPLKPILPALRRFVGRSATARQIWLNAPRFPAEMVLTNEAVTGTFSWLGQVMDDRIIEDLKIHIAFPPTVFRAFPSEVSLGNYPTSWLVKDLPNSDLGSFLFLSHAAGLGALRAVVLYFAEYLHRPDGHKRFSKCDA
ncbi:hypothetical protein CALCODRAFT_514048 [Calocera cornea HHB12733]|uniref:F-box domain-containing protein n=1 Tax=Calocera cornea HHB12733 TaxID=1353952 RepID=A0A165K103_9BASI|nr:hypothetical protein CALCODRAFT_514048 [Calocera cornea HHB12733]